MYMEKCPQYYDVIELILLLLMQDLYVCISCTGLHRSPTIQGCFKPPLQPLHCRPAKQNRGPPVVSSSAHHIGTSTTFRFQFFLALKFSSCEPIAASPKRDGGISIAFGKPGRRGCQLLWHTHRNLEPLLVRSRKYTPRYLSPRYTFCRRGLGRLQGPLRISGLAAGTPGGSGRSGEVASYAIAGKLQGPGDSIVAVLELHNSLRTNVVYNSAAGNRSAARRSTRPQGDGRGAGCKPLTGTDAGR